MTKRNSIPVLEVGGTHVTAALVDNATCMVQRNSLVHMPLSADGTADELVHGLVAAANTLGSDHSDVWSIAIPGPFDYENGIGLFEHVGKFDSLLGMNLRSALVAGIRPTPADVHFLNDADAFGIGEYAIGAARGYDRVICITLGTGVGSAFLVRGEPVKSGPLVPLDGSVHRLDYRGRPLEDTVSSRAIRKAYASFGEIDGNRGPDVHDIAERSRRGDEAAGQVLQEAFENLGMALGPVVECFNPSVLVVGGSIARSWDIVKPSIRTGLIRAVPSLDALIMKPAEHAGDAAISGAAYWVRQRE